jgi:hypothetical protein
MGFWSDVRDSLNEMDRSSKYTDEDAKRVTERLRQDIDISKLRQKIGQNTPLDYVDEGEQVIYYLSGFDLDIDGDDEGYSSAFMVTDQKLVFLASSMTGKSSQYTVSYQDVIGVSTQQRFTSQIQIETAGHSYKISAAGEKPDLVKEAAEYIRKRKEEFDTKGQDAGEPDPLDKLDKLADLRDKGAISEKEYNEQKEKLLSDI